MDVKHQVYLLHFISLLWLTWQVIVTISLGASYCRPFNSLVKAFNFFLFYIHMVCCPFLYIWLRLSAVHSLYAGWASPCQPLHSSRETTQHRYCRCRPLVVTFVYHEFGTLSCATKLAKVTHFWTNYCRDWKCSPVISPGDICSLISWRLSFWGCKRQEFPWCVAWSTVVSYSFQYILTCCLTLSERSN